MNDAFVRFVVEPACSSFGIPEWMWGRTLQVRIPVSTLAELHGEGGAATGEEIFQQHRTLIERMADRKIAAFDERPPEPVTVELADLNC